MSGSNGVAVEEAATLICDIPCICPNAGHGEAGDHVTFRETLDYTAVRAIRYTGAIAREEDPESSIATLMAAMNEGFLLHGIESWTVRDGRNQLIEVSKTNIRQFVLANVEVALVLGDFADMLYQPQVLHPLAVLAKRSSQPSPTPASTSVPNGSPSTSPEQTEALSDASSTPSAKPPKRSRRSSTTTTPTDSTGATSFDSDGAFTS